jgi:hypothetical protein
MGSTGTVRRLIARCQERTPVVHLGAGESMFIPRNVEHTWGGSPAQVLNAYQPAGKIEQFFQALGKYKDLPTGEQAASRTYTDEQIDTMKRLFEDHAMVLTGPGLVDE